MQSKDRPYILIVAEKIYFEISNQTLIIMCITNESKSPNVEM